MLIPVLLFVVLAIAQFGGLYNHYVTITDATRRSVHGRGFAHGHQSDRARHPGGRDSAHTLDQRQLNVTVSPAPPWTGGQQITVTASYPYALDLAGLVVKSGSLDQLDQGAGGVKHRVREDRGSALAFVVARRGFRIVYGDRDLHRLLLAALAAPDRIIDSAYDAGGEGLERFEAAAYHSGAD